jgi:hypothetical protein
MVIEVEERLIVSCSCGQYPGRNRGDDRHPLNIHSTPSLSSLSKIRLEVARKRPMPIQRRSNFVVIGCFAQHIARSLLSLKVPTCSFNRQIHLHPSQLQLGRRAAQRSAAQYNITECFLFDCRRFHHQKNTISKETSKFLGNE